MKLLVTTNARLYKSTNGKYYTPMVYGHDFFLRYLNIFDQVKLVAHTKNIQDKSTAKMLCVSGPGIEIHEVPYPVGKLQYLKMYFKIKNSLKNCFVDCDAALLRVPDQLAFQLYPILRKNNIPTSVEVTSDSWEFFAPGYKKSFIRPLLRVLWHFQQKYVCRTALGTSYVTKYGLQKRYPPTRALKKDGFTTNYTSAEISVDALNMPKLFESQKRQFTIIHVSGNIYGYTKGHKELITALTMLQGTKFNIKLVLVGAGNLSDDIVQIIKENHIEDQIIFTGLIKDKNLLHDELKNADIFVFPSYREGLPRVVIEAMACGLPCIATDLPGIRELLDNDCLVPVRDSKALADKILELISNPEKLNKLSARNLEKAKEYSIETIEKKRNDFYNKLKNVAIKRRTKCLKTKSF